MNRRQVAGLIVAAWLASLGWLVRREVLRSRPQALAELDRPVPPGASFYALRLGAQQIGYASSTVDTLADSIRVEDLLQLELPALGTVHRTDARTVAWLTRQLRLRSFEAVMRGDLGAFVARGRVSGDTVLAVELQSGGSSQRLRVPLRQPIVLPGLLPAQAVFGARLKVGREFTLRLFDPLLLAERDIGIRVTGDSTFVLPDSAAYDSISRTWVPARWDTVRAWRLEQNLGGVALAAWVDQQGRIVRAQSAVGFTMERTAFELAHENFRLRDRSAEAKLLDAGDVISQTAIASNVRLEDGLRDRLAVRLLGVELEGFDLAGGRQALKGDTLVIRVESPRQLAGAYRLPATDPALAPYLEAEPLIQATDPRIQAQARQIAGRVRNPRQVAERLTRWVYQHLDKQVTLSVPSAVQVLEARRGDCNEHTVLYVALARALGLPARTAAGVVYLRGRFYYHAWPEVYLNGWVAVDPTFGQFPADASHVRFTIGGLARQMELIRLIGRLRLEVVGTS